MRSAVAVSALVALASAGQWMQPSESEVWVTSTLLSTTTSTVISCHPTVTNCPGHPELQTETKTVTSVITIGTTVCPATMTSSASTSPSATYASSTPKQESSTPCPTSSPYSSPAGGEKMSSTPCPSSSPYSSPAGGEKMSSSTPSAPKESTCTPVTETCTVTVTAPAKPTYPASSSAAPYKASSSGAPMKPYSSNVSPVQFTGAASANNAAGFIAGVGAFAALLL